MSTIERCYGCGAERDIELNHRPWPQVEAPGTWPDDEARRDRLILCPPCAGKVHRPILTVDDLWSQLRHKPYMFKKSLVKVDRQGKLWFEMRRMSMARMGTPMNTDLLAWECRAFGITAEYAAVTRGRAKTMCARAIVETGYARTMGDAYRAISCRRAPWQDSVAIGKGKEGFLFSSHRRES